MPLRLPTMSARRWGSLAAILVLLTLASIPHLVDSIQDARQGSEKKYEDRRARLEAAIEDWEAEVAPDHPARLPLQHAHYALLLAETARDRSLEAAHDRLTEGFADLCDVQESWMQRSCPPQPGFTIGEFLGRPLVAVALTMISAITSGWTIFMSGIVQGFLQRLAQRK